MKRIETGFIFVLMLLLSASYIVTAQNPGSWNIPAGGNSFLVHSASERDKEGKLWQSPEDRKLFFFRIDKACKLELFFNLAVPEGKSRIKVTVAGRRFNLDVSGKDLHRVKIGKVTAESGYIRVEVQGIRKSGSQFAVISDLEVHPGTSGLTPGFVRDNTDNRFYWGRRGPSVHLSYELPKGVEAEYFYNEVTVPVGQDPEGSYFMADGFGEGYFGMQVNGPSERRILFSVWSPYKTDNPGEIPESDKIILLAKGEEVHTGEFGNEGSGGQSYFRYPWKAGSTYRFLLKGTPDGKGNVTFTAWFFAPEVAKWQLIASFSRPKTDHYLTRLHSFLENFNDHNGYLGRKALYTNTWCRDKKGEWYPLTKARFTGDDIARRGYRLDYAGGTEGNGFFLQNGGFFNTTTALNSSFELKKSALMPPTIDFSVLK